MKALIGPIEIRFPSDPGLSRVLRLAASGVASLANYTVDEIDDIKIAVSEIFIALIEHGTGSSIEIRLFVDDDGFHVRGHSAAENFDIENPDFILCRRVLEGVGAEHGVDVDAGFARVWATVRHSSPT
jgi:anti-sigma regulatory factor (Ser/Thr protein kinase)